MARAPEALRAALDELVAPEARSRLLARGLARGMVWNDGVVSPGGPPFAASLTGDLLDFGYGVLALALELRDANGQRPPEARFETTDAFGVAAEALEAAVRRGSPNDPEQGRHLVVGAAALHLAGFAARSFSLLPLPALEKNLASPERALGLLLRRDMTLLREHIAHALGDPLKTDEAVAVRLISDNDQFDIDDVVFLSLAKAYHQAIGRADSAIIVGDEEGCRAAISALRTVASDAGEVGNLDCWWTATLSAHLVSDLWDQGLHARLPIGPRSDLPTRWTQIRRDFIDVLGARRPPQLDLWPSQLAAAERATNASDDLVIALPTSAGKTRIAELCILRALADGKRTVYVTPLRALSAQVERVLARTFVPLGASVTSLYGAAGATSIDVHTLESADIVVSTPEKLDFALRQDANVLNDVGLIVFDEGHMIGLGSREIRYEVLIQRLLRRRDSASRRIVCLSAMFNADDPYFQDFANWLRNDANGGALSVRWRPTRQRLATLDWRSSAGAARLEFIGGEEAFILNFFKRQEPRGTRKKAFPSNDIEFCIGAANAFARDGHSVLIYSPQRNQIEALARAFHEMERQGFLSDIRPPDQAHLAFALAIGSEWLGNDHPAVAGLSIGVGCHHGALPRPFLSAVEDLLNERRLPVVVASPTLAQGIDLACSVLIFRSLQRFDPESGTQAAISSAEFANVVGRAGRAYVDLDGITVMPTFESGYARTSRHALFKQLISESRGQRLVSGLARLVNEIGNRIAVKLGVPSASLIEYIANHADLWQDARLTVSESLDDDTEDAASFSDFVSDLDVALLSLIDPLDAPADALAALLDDVLESSLWNRTLTHVNESISALQRPILDSRAQWIWHSTNVEQRRACFYAGLGTDAGLFLNERLDKLVSILADCHGAVLRDDQATVVETLVSFAGIAAELPFFSMGSLPTDWESALRKWINGTAFAAILSGRKPRDAQRTQSMIQDGAIFRLVWAAEAVRIQAVAIGHGRAAELGDGPALVLTHGVPSIAAALLCQSGFASRVGALSAARRLRGTFTDVLGMNEWMRANRELLSRQEFWETEGQYLMWCRMLPSGAADVSRVWQRVEYSVRIDWTAAAPSVGTALRVIAHADGSATVCSTDLTPLARVTLPFNPERGSHVAEVVDSAHIRITRFGPP